MCIGKSSLIHKHAVMAAPDAEYEYTDGLTTYAYARYPSSTAFSQHVARIAFVARQLRASGVLRSNETIRLYGADDVSVSVANGSRMSTGAGRAKRVQFDDHSLPSPDRASDRQIEQMVGERALRTRAVILEHEGRVIPTMMSLEEADALEDHWELMRDAHVVIDPRAYVPAVDFGKVDQLLTASQYSLPLYYAHEYFTPRILDDALAASPRLTLWLLNGYETRLFQDVDAWSRAKRGKVHFVLVMEGFVRPGEIDAFVDVLLQLMNALRTQFVFTFVRTPTRMNDERDLLPSVHPLWSKVTRAGATISMPFDAQPLPRSFTQAMYSTSKFAAKRKEYHHTVMTILRKHSDPSDDAQPLALLDDLLLDQIAQALAWKDLFGD